MCVLPYYWGMVPASDTDVILGCLVAVGEKKSEMEDVITVKGYVGFYFLLFFWFSVAWKFNLNM